MPNSESQSKKGFSELIKKATEGVSKAAESIGSSIASTATTAANAVNESISESIGKYGDTAITGITKTANSIGNTIADTVKKVGNQSVKLVDQNGDGKLDEEDMIIALNTIYGKAINGIPKISKSVKEVAEEYLNSYPDVENAAKKMIDNAVVKCTTSGFLTGFGGFIVLPVTLPANVTSVIYVQMRMIATVACMVGLDVESDATQTLVYACLAGVSVAEIIKKAGIQIGQKLTNAMVKKIPGKVLTKINQKVGFRLLTKFGEKGIINIGKMIPIVGAVISGGFDLAETKIIANRAYKEFIEGDYKTSSENKENDNSKSTIEIETFLVDE